MTKPVVFRTNRAYAAQVAIVQMAFTILLGWVVARAFGAGLVSGNTLVFGFGLLVSCFFGVFLFLSYRAVLITVQPDTLTLSRAGWTMTRFGHPSSYFWADYNRPTTYVTSGRGEMRYIRMEPRIGGRSVLIPAGNYTESFDGVMQAVMIARSGQNAVCNDEDRQTSGRYDELAVVRRA